MLQILRDSQDTFRSWAQIRSGVALRHLEGICISVRGSRGRHSTEMWKRLEVSNSPRRRPSRALAAGREAARRPRQGACIPRGTAPQLPCSDAPHRIRVGPWLLWGWWEEGPGGLRSGPWMAEEMRTSLKTWCGESASRGRPGAVPCQEEEAARLSLQDERPPSHPRVSRAAPDRACRVRVQPQPPPRTGRSWALPPALPRAAASLHPPGRKGDDDDNDALLPGSLLLPRHWRVCVRASFCHATQQRVIQAENFG